MPKISIIVPIYKAESYLHRCIDSILSQTFTDWELLLVDDGSPDKSGEICDEYANKDVRIKVFHKENGGVSSARNFGLNYVKGEYITFIDADDWIDNQNLFNCNAIIEANNLDILQYSWKRIDDDKNVLQVRTINTEVLELQNYMSKGNFNVCVGGSCIKSSIIKENNIRFDEKLKLAEDQIFILLAMTKSHRLKATSTVYYNYYFNKNSATNNTKLEDIENGIAALIEFKKEYPIFKSHCDKMILCFMMDALRKSDCNRKQLADIYKVADISDIITTDKHEQLFVILSKINVKLATFVLSKLFSVDL